MSVSYPKSDKYFDLDTIYTGCSGPSSLQLAEFMAEKMGVRPGARLLDIGIARGYQTCFLAKEYGLLVIGLDPGDDRANGIPHIEHLLRNARAWGRRKPSHWLEIGRTGYPLCRKHLRLRPLDHHAGNGARGFGSGPLSPMLSRDLPHPASRRNLRTGRAHAP